MYGALGHGYGGDGGGGDGDGGPGGGGAGGGGEEAAFVVPFEVPEGMETVRFALVFLPGCVRSPASSSLSHTQTTHETRNQTAQPTTSKQHRLIGMTARRARADPQLEIVLKVIWAIYHLCVALLLWCVSLIISFLTPHPTPPLQLPRR